MAGVVVKVDNKQILAGIDETRLALGDVPLMLRVAGELMRASVAHTFRDEGSPAKSWPKLAASTMKKKAYTTGHKLLVLSGRLFGSITYQVTGNTLTIGTNLVYAAVQQFGSADRRGGSVGPQARITGREVKLKSGRTRFQNIPARPFLVFRPEDPGRIMRGFETYLAGKLVRVGKVVSTKTSAGVVVNMQGVMGGLA